MGQTQIFNAGQQSVAFHGIHFTNGQGGSGAGMGMYHC